MKGELEVGNVKFNMDFNECIKGGVEIYRTSQSNTVSASECCRPSVGAYHLPTASIEPIKLGGWTGAISEGSSVNCEVLNICVHGSCTHTECLRHIVEHENSPYIKDQLPVSLFPSVALCVTPQSIKLNVNSSLDSNIENIVSKGELVAKDEVEQDLAVTSFAVYEATLKLISMLQHNGVFDLSHDPEKDQLEKVVKGVKEDARCCVNEVINATKCYKQSTNQNIGDDVNDSENNLDTDNQNISCNGCTLAASLISNHKTSTFPFPSLSPSQTDTLRALSRGVILQTLTPQVWIRLNEKSNDNTNVENTDNSTEECTKNSRLDMFKNSSNPITVSALGHASFSGSNPPYITPAAMCFLRTVFQLDHLLADLPSLDREDDGGHLLSHKILFRYDEFVKYITCKKDVLNSSTFETDYLSWKNKTATELCWFNTILDNGVYVVDLKTVYLESDASPTMPILYPLNFNSINFSQ